MKMNSEVTVYGVKESSGTVEGRPFSSTTFHLDVDLKDNSVGRAVGIVTRPFKLGDHKEFEKWTNHSYPLKARAMFDVTPGADNSVKLELLAIAPAGGQPQKAA